MPTPCHVRQKQPQLHHEFAQRITGRCSRCTTTVDWYIRDTASHLNQAGHGKTPGSEGSCPIGGVRARDSEGDSLGPPPAPSARVNDFGVRNGGGAAKLSLAAVYRAVPPLLWRARNPKPAAATARRETPSASGLRYFRQRSPSHPCTLGLEHRMRGSTGGKTCSAPAQPTNRWWCQLFAPPLLICTFRPHFLQRPPAVWHMQGSMKRKSDGGCRFGWGGGSLAS